MRVEARCRALAGRLIRCLNRRDKVRTELRRDGLTTERREALDVRLAAFHREQDRLEAELTAAAWLLAARESAA